MKPKDIDLPEGEGPFEIYLDGGGWIKRTGPLCLDRWYKVKYRYLVTSTIKTGDSYRSATFKEDWENWEYVLVLYYGNRLYSIQV